MLTKKMTLCQKSNKHNVSKVKYITTLNFDQSQTTTSVAIYANTCGLKPNKF